MVGMISGYDDKVQHSWLNLVPRTYKGLFTSARTLKEVSNLILKRIKVLGTKLGFNCVFKSRFYIFYKLFNFLYTQSAETQPSYAFNARQKEL